MNFNWKLPAIGGGIAFVLSALAGLIGGVGFGTILLRALIGGVVFGALAIGIDFALRRTMPELFQPSVAEDSSQGGTVDITIDEDIPQEATSEMDVTEAAFESSDNDFMNSADGEEAVTENLSESAELQIDAAESVGEEPVAKSGSLPSFDSVESTFATEETEGDSDESRSSESSVDVLGAEEDPALVAEAVRTLMKRDREG